jgi:Uma2 family endonuclease
LLVARAARTIHDMTLPRPKTRPATWDDLLDVPEHLTGEIVEGELVVHPRPGTPHTVVASDLGMLLGGTFRFGSGGGPGGWVILAEPGIVFGNDIRAPDLAGWRRDRWPGTTAQGPILAVPDWVCEVLSPRTRRADRAEKMPLYAAHGVQFAWLVSPTDRSLEAYRLVGDRWLLLGVYTGGDVRVEPFDAVPLSLDAVFSLLPPLDEDAPA